MTVAILSIGTELTRGELVNSNSAWLSSALIDAGFEVTEHAVVDDSEPRIADALRRLCTTHELAIATGGLGPTTDDLTRESVAQLLGVPLVQDDTSLEHIRRRFEKFRRTMSASNLKQALFPEGAEILPNANGTAPGFSVAVSGLRCFFLPGVPSEMRSMFEDHVLPKIRPLAENRSYQVRLRTYGLPESTVGEMLSGVEEAYAGVTLGYRATFPEIEVKVLARGDDYLAARALADRAEEEVRRRLGGAIFGEGDESFAGAVGRLLRRKGVTLAVAESCTGGLVGHLLTRDPGASDFLLLDAVTYANSAKSHFLGVNEETIRWHGAVSAEVAAAMAEGVRHRAGSDFALSITGIAGPSGGSEEKPVGTVFLGVAGPSRTIVREKHFAGDRERVQMFAAYAGLSLLRDECLG